MGWTRDRGSEVLCQPSGPGTRHCSATLPINLALERPPPRIAFGPPGPISCPSTKRSEGQTLSIITFLRAIGHRVVICRGNGIRAGARIQVCVLRVRERPGWAGLKVIAIFAQIAEFGRLRDFCDYCDLCDPFLMATRAPPRRTSTPPTVSRRTSLVTCSQRSLRETSYSGRGGRPAGRDGRRGTWNLDVGTTVKFAAAWIVGSLAPARFFASSRGTRRRSSTHRRRRVSAIAAISPSELLRSERNTNASVTRLGALVTPQTMMIDCSHLHGPPDGLRGRSRASGDAGRKGTLAGGQSLLRPRGAFPARGLSDALTGDGSALSGSSRSDCSSAAPAPRRPTPINPSLSSSCDSLCRVRMVRTSDT